MCEIELYSSQTEQVLSILKRDGVCCSRAEYVRKKYGESAEIFLLAYSSFVREAEKLLPKPEKAEYPYWAFLDPRSVDLSGGGVLSLLLVPVSEVLFFDAWDWYKVLRLSYIGENEEEEKEFARELSLRGLDSNKVMLSSFYPEWKERILKSWSRLFRFDPLIRSGDYSCVHSVQAALWMLKKEWLR